MPGNGLTFAIKICRQVHGFCFFCRLDDVFYVLLAAFVELVSHGEIIFGINCAVSRGQIPDVTIRSQYLEISAQVSVNGARFGG